MHTDDSVPLAPGKGNLGQKGFQRFLQTHQVYFVGCGYTQLTYIPIVQRYMQVITFTSSKRQTGRYGNTAGWAWNDVQTSRCGKCAMDRTGSEQSSNLPHRGSMQLTLLIRTPTNQLTLTRDNHFLLAAALQTTLLGNIMRYKVAGVQKKQIKVNVLVPALLYNRLTTKQQLDRLCCTYSLFNLRNCTYLILKFKKSV